MADNPQLELEVANDTGTPIPVSGPLTDTQIRATALPVSGPLTDTQLRASAVPVSGPLTDAQMRASDAPVISATANVLTGAVTETAPASDTASSGLNGRLQRLAQRITSLIALLPTTIGQKLTATSLSVTIASDQTVPISQAIISDTSKGREYASYAPNPASYPGVISESSLDFSDQTMTRGQVLSDEGSFRDNFSGSSLTRNLSGSGQFNSSSTGVGGVGGPLFTTEIKFGDYVKRSADAESAYTQVDYVAANNQLYLTQNYLGSSGTAAAVVSNWKQFTGTGGTLTVSNSILSIASSTTNGNLVGINRSGDYPPYNLAGKFSVSQRIANQVITFGFQDIVTTPTIQACFIFDGTSNTSVKCRTSCSSAAAETQESTVTLPVGDTSTNHVYSVDITVTTVTYLIDGVVMATHEDYIPGPYDNMEVNLLIKNNATVTTTTVACDWIGFENVDQVEVTSGFKSESFKIKPADAPRSYSATIVGLVPATTPTDIFSITGSATKTVKVKNITVSGTQTTAGVINVLLVKRSAANTGGTSTNPTAVNHDSVDAGATATINAYTANPSLGATVGTVNAIRQWVPTATGIPSVEEFFFGDAPFKKEIILRGIAQVFSVNLNSVTVAGGSIDISIEWTEE